MRKLVLYIRKTSWHPSLEPSLLVTTTGQGEEIEAEVGPKGQFDNRSRRSINGLLFLILNTFLDRKASQERGEEIQIKSVGPKYFSFLSTLYNSKQEEARKWQEDIFKKSPFYPPEQFLERQGSPQTKTTEVYILKDVKLDIQAQEKGETLSDLDLHPFKILKDGRTQLSTCSGPLSSMSAFFTFLTNRSIEISAHINSQQERTQPNQQATDRGKILRLSQLQKSKWNAVEIRLKPFLIELHVTGHFQIVPPSGYPFLRQKRNPHT